MASLAEPFYNGWQRVIQPDTGRFRFGDDSFPLGAVMEESSEQLDHASGMESSRPVKIASYLTVPQAELARVQLAMHGIPARLGNAAFLSWCWHLSNAVGGATLFVSAGDIGPAMEVLDTSGPKDETATSTGPCAECGQPSERAWEICWNCGMAVDGTEDPDFGRQDHLADQSQWNGNGPVLGITAFVTVVLVLLTRGSLWMVVPWMVSFPVFFLLGGFRREDLKQPSPNGVIPSGAEPRWDAADQSRDRRRRMGEAIILRAWRVAIFGWFACPPLFLYTVYLLVRLDGKKTPPGRVGRCRYVAAWVVVTAGILCYGSMASLMLGDMMGNPFYGIVETVYRLVHFLLLRI